MVRVPTYSSYMSLLNQTLKNKATAEEYSYQTTTGIKYATYAGYGIQAGNMVNMETSLSVTQNFMDNNTLLNTSIKTMSTVMENVESAVTSLKSQFNNALSAFDSLEQGQPISSDVSTSLNELQTMAFSTMSLLSDALNQYVGDKYIFGAGSSSAPTNFTFATLDEFQQFYDGKNIIYPQDTSALLSNRTADYASSGDLTISQSATAANEFVLHSDKGFSTTAVVGSEQTTGTLKLSSIDDTLHAEVYGAFNTIQAGNTLILNDGTNQMAYTVKSVSADGKTITFEEDITFPAGSDDEITYTNGTGVTIDTSFSVGTVLEFGGSNDVPELMQVVGIEANGDLIVRANQDEFTTLPQNLGADSHWSLKSHSYYVGVSANETFRISGNQTITFDINANDAVFTKLFSALGTIAQGNLIPTDDDGNVGDTQAFKDLINSAMNLLQSSIDNNGRSTNAKNETLSMCIAKISANYVTLNNANNTLESIKGTLEDNIYDIKNVDQTEAAAKLLLAQNSLEASYQVLTSSLQLSLLDYLK